MLTRFCVENFKTFQSRLEFDLGNPGNYEFNMDAINMNEGVISKAAIYGFNGCGKSTLGLAIFDIVSSLTDREKGLRDYEPYLNLNNSNDKPARFEYYFVFDGVRVSYIYEKTRVDAFVKESLRIDDKEVLHYDFHKHEGIVTLSGAETLSLTSDENAISRVKYLRSNAILKDNRENTAFKEFISFVDNMLMFYSLDETRYRGYRTGQERIPDAIIEAGKLKEFEQFLHRNNISINLMGLLGELIKTIPAQCLKNIVFNKY